MLPLVDLGKDVIANAGDTESLFAAGTNDTGIQLSVIVYETGGAS
jgi:hypothetical protein